MSQPLLTVLHIDDDPDTRFLLQQLLTDAAGTLEPGEIRLLEASGFDDALNHWTCTRLDGILLDNRLGAVDGVDLLPRLRTAWNCPVWILTGLVDEPLRNRCRQGGAAGLLGKDELLGDPGALRSFLLRSFASR